MEKEQLYFKNIDANICYSLSTHLNDAKIDGLDKVTLVEAIPDNDNADHIWCRQHGEVVVKSDCSKKYCNYYQSKSGRGRCSNKGRLFMHGYEVTFDVPKISVKT